MKIKNSFKSNFTLKMAQKSNSQHYSLLCKKKLQCNFFYIFFFN